MYAIFQSGAHQYVGAVDDVLRIEKIAGEPGDEVTFDQVLMVREDEQVKVGAPFVKGGKVVAKVVEQGRGPKIIVFKYKPKKHYKKIMGHRQDFTAIQVSAIKG
jgi:large subunit ribosomal protein L21